MALNRMQQQTPTSKASEYYSGQWTSEEQDYVACLMDGFKVGSLDIPDGTSLRFFIAAKLGCKPKRVSKKYERSGYNGKQVYRRDITLPAEESGAYRERLKECEQKFKDSRALVMSMQEAKTDNSKPVIPIETPIISLAAGTLGTSNASSSSAMEDRLVAMRSQIDRAANLLSSMGPPSVAAVAPMNRFSTNPILGTGTGTGTGSCTGHGVSSLDMRQALMIQQSRQRAALAAGFCRSLPFSGLAARSPLQHAGSTPAGPGPGPGPANKLLIELYQRRQQLIMAHLAAGGSPDWSAVGYAAAAGMPSSTTASLGSDGGTILGEKRVLEDLEVEDQAHKRARAA